jgi:hypothetical protein
MNSNGHGDDSETAIYQIQLSLTRRFKLVYRVCRSKLRLRSIKSRLVYRVCRSTSKLSPPDFTVTASGQLEGLFKVEVEVQVTGPLRSKSMFVQVVPLWHGHWHWHWHLPGARGPGPFGPSAMGLFKSASRLGTKKLPADSEVHVKCWVLPGPLPSR